MMEFLEGRYGNAFMSALHDDDGNGLAGLQDVLERDRPHQGGGDRTFSTTGA